VWCRGSGSGGGSGGGGVRSRRGGGVTCKKCPLKESVAYTL